MQYEKRIVCFFDILGFSTIINNKEKDADEISRLFSEIRAIIDDYSSDDIQISPFSDCFVISIRKTTASPTQLRFIVEVLLKLLKYNLIARGAIVYGELVHTQCNIFGPALVKAAHLERCKAIVPRIILDDSLSELTLPTIGGSKISYTGFFSGFAYVSKDPDDFVHYVDFIAELPNKDETGILRANLKKLVERGLQSEDDNIKRKYLWLENKFWQLHSS